MKGTRHRQRQEKKKTCKLPKKREKHKTEGEETVARQHKTYTRIWQGIHFFFLRFLSPGLQWKYSISSTPVFPYFENHKATERTHLLCCFLAAGSHTTGVWPQILSSTSYMLLESPGITETLPYRITHRVSSPQRVRESGVVIVQLALHGGF